MEINPIIKVPPAQYRQAPLTPAEKNNSKMLLIILIGIVVIAGAGAAYYFFFAKGNANSNNENLVVANQNQEANSNSQPSQNRNTNTSSNKNTNGGIMLNDNTGLNTNSLANTNAIDLPLDEDEDGMNDLLEGYYGTSDLKADSDGDSYSDADEVKNCYNPISSGKIDDRFFSDTFCINIWSGNLSIQDKPALRQEMLDICRQWKPFAEAYLRALDADGDALALLESDNATYRASCGPTEDYFETAEVFNELEALRGETITAADICDAMAYTAAYLCVKKLDSEIPPISFK
ncbi:MAG: hypothetical protein PHY34_02460 [Patescibacteria group bacterium]|nr:hypothetical protein [Patescibacteria group bacterium]MDD5715200.1 hypothetical protein [Patescibacteria group bacterium]